MELDLKKSKTLKISLVILAVIILLSIGAAIGSHSGRNRDYGNDGYGCGNFSRFERGGRQDARQFRMMPNQRVNDNQLIQTPANSTSASLEAQISQPTATSTPIK